MPNPMPKVLAPLSLLAALALAGCSEPPEWEPLPESQATAAAEAPAAQPATEGETATQAEGAPALPPDAAAGQDPAAAQERGRTPDFDFAPGGPIPDAELGNYHAALTFAVDGEEVGTLTLEMWPEKAPGTARNFLRYCDEGFYDGTPVHRVLRDFMIQGGDPSGTGMGSGPHGRIRDELSEDPKWGHGYGVISMAHSGPNTASSQFFICNSESASVWNLDGKYSSFGRMTSGVATLEAVSNVPTTRNRAGEPSAPTKKITLVRARAVQGEPPRDETIERPLPDLGGQPPKVLVQHLLVSFEGAGTTAARSKEEAAKLAADLLERARAGESFDALVREHSDDRVAPDDQTPGHYRMLNRGVLDVASERAHYDAQKELGALQQELGAKMNAGELTSAEAQARLEARRKELVAALEAVTYAKRTQMVKAFGDLAFSLEPGAFGMTEFHEEDSPFGWHIMRRIE